MVRSIFSRCTSGVPSGDRAPNGRRRSELKGVECVDVEDPVRWCGPERTHEAKGSCSRNREWMAENGRSDMYVGQVSS